MSKTLLLSILSLLTVVLFTFTGCQTPQGFHSSSDPWEKEPAKPADGLAGPREEKPAGLVLLGKDKFKNKDGDPDSSVEKKVKCGDEAERWCSITLSIQFEPKDKERLKITSTGADGKTREVYLKGAAASKEITISGRGCKEHTVKVEIVETKQSTKKNIQSWAEVKLMNNLRCDPKDQTNKEGFLVDASGEPLPKPESIE
jgi:hypothetical protein